LSDVQRHKCKWHCVQGEEHVLLDCPSADLANLRVKHHHLLYNPPNSQADDVHLSAADTQAGGGAPATESQLSTLTTG